MKGRHVLVLHQDLEMHVGHHKVQLGEEARPARLVDQLVDEMLQRLHQLLSDGVEPAVVLPEAPRPVRLLLKHDQGGL